MTAPDVNAAFAAALVDEWVRCGCTDAVVAPGSRSAPLAIALARDGRLRLRVVLDERSAAFVALGLAVASGRPAVLLCTSGTAAVNFHPAVVEAFHARVPMIVCAADRPPELRDVGAGQTIDQTMLFGNAVRWFHDPGPPTTAGGAGAEWRVLACRAYAAAAGPPAGPVHLNLPFREPLVPTGGERPGAPGRAGGRPYVETLGSAREPDGGVVERVARFVEQHPRGLVVAGWGSGASHATVQRFAAAAGWPVLADAISNVRSGPRAVSTYEALLRSESFVEAHRPDAVLRIGAPLTSKIANGWLDRVLPQLVVDADGRWLDPGRAASVRVVAGTEQLLGRLCDARAGAGAGAWASAWMSAERVARAALDGVLDALDTPIEGRIARDLAAALPSGANLVVASSLPVRALEWCMAPRADIRIFSNRGANGIDGFVSTALGIASTDPSRPTYALCGDLCFLHDTNGLLTAHDGGAVTFVVVDNDGGGIFSFLPQAGLPEFETLFGTPHGVDLVEVARAHGVAAERAKDVDLTASPGTRVVVVPVDRATSAARHRDVLAAASVSGSARP